MVRYNQTIGILQRILSIYSFTLILLFCYTALLFINLQRYDIPLLLLTLIFIIHLLFILFSKSFRIIKSIIFSDEAQHLILEYYQYGFLVKKKSIPYNSLKYWVGSRGRLQTPPYGIRFYMNKDFIAEIQEYRYNWQPTQVAVILDKLIKTSNPISSINKELIKKITESVMNTSRIFSLIPVYFKKLQMLIWIPFFPVVVFGFLYISNTSHIWLYMVFSLILLAGMLFVFYLTRYEIITLATNDNDFSLEYFNRSFFKKKPFRGKKSDVKVLLEGDNINLIYNDILIAILRPAAASDTEWQEIREYFQV